MPASIPRFENVTLLITHYNRCDSLERLLNSFQELSCEFGDIVVSDDGSEVSNLNRIRKMKDLYKFRLIESPINKGLGNNINKGQDAILTPYTLYIQEDFIPKASFPIHFMEALKIMEQDKCWDMITFYSYAAYPYLVPYKNGFSEKIFRSEPWYTNNLKFYLYGDHPHLRVSNFFEKFGRYKEGINGDKTELEMSLSFIKNGGRSLFYDDLYGLLEQKNSNDEPSTASFRKNWTQSGHAIISILRWFYLKYKFLKLNIRLLKIEKRTCK